MASWTNHIRIAPGAQANSVCAVFDGDEDGSVSAAEIVAAVGAALTGCPD